MSKKKVLFFTCSAFVIVLFIVGIVKLTTGISQRMEEQLQADIESGKHLEDLYDSVAPKENKLVKGALKYGNFTLFDELPPIDKYPLGVTGSADVVVEVFSSDEKAGKGADSWLLDTAEKFNKSGVTVDGKSVAVSVRNVSSGLGADFIASGKYKPQMYTPSSAILGAYVEANGGKLTCLESCLVGNQAGILVEKGKYSDITTFITAVQNGEVNFGYSNPQISPTGMNLLLEILHMGDPENMFSDKAVEFFKKFQSNITYIADTTTQLRDNMSSGMLDGMVMEYKSYFADENLKSIYDFIPFGLRHDNPLYIVPDACDDLQKKACEEFAKYCKSEKVQAKATELGFNQNPDYAGGRDVTGAEITKALKLYKENKDVGKSVIAVFVTDRSGSMQDEPMIKLKESLTNCIKYINETSMIGMVSYSSSVTIDLPIKQFDLDQKAYFQGAIDSLEARGGTASYDACIVGLHMLKEMHEQKPDSIPILILLSDGNTSDGHSYSQIEGVAKKLNYPIYTVAYGKDADLDALTKLANLNEATCLVSDSEDVVYRLKSLFNART